MFLAPKIHFNKLLCCSIKLNANIQLCIHLFIDLMMWLPEWNFDWVKFFVPKGKRRKFYFRAAATRGVMKTIQR